MATSSTRSRVPGEERVFSLVLALVATSNGLTRGELLSSVYGYADRYVTGRESAAIERQFERDKEQLRQLGIPIETIDTPGSPGDNRLTRYRISKERLQLPASLRFTEAELTVLRLGALAWSEGSLGAHSRWATMRLASLTSTPDLRLLGIAPQISFPEPGAVVLQQAIDERRTVQFDYRLPQHESALRRHVAPLRLHRAHGRWHLIAWDFERDGDRVFLLSRITSEIAIENKHFEPSLFDRVDPSIERLLAIADAQRVRVIACRGSAAESRLLARSETVGFSPTGDPIFEFGSLDLHELADELLSFGDDVTALWTEDLRELMVERLQLIADQHLANDTGGGTRDETA